MAEKMEAEPFRHFQCNLFCQVRIYLAVP